MLWGNKDYSTGNNKPLWANTSNSTSNSTINRAAANTMKFYGIVAGVSATEQQAVQTATSTPHPQHAGWVSLKPGTGPITGITVTGGTGINAAGYLTITDTSAWGNGRSANISFTIANSQNSLQGYSTNSTLNTISTITPPANMPLNAMYLVYITNSGSGILTINATGLGSGIKTTYTSAVSVPATTGLALGSLTKINSTPTYIWSVNLVA